MTARESSPPNTPARTVLALWVMLPIACASNGTPSDKAAFVKLVRELPHQGEFLTDTANDRAAPSIGLLVSLRSEDLAGQDLYPFLALSQGLCDREVPRRYAIEHFREFGHPDLKMFWAAVLFDRGSQSGEIVRYLDTSLKSDEEAKRLAEIVGPTFPGFSERVRKAAAGSHGG